MMKNTSCLTTLCSRYGKRCHVSREDLTEHMRHLRTGATPGVCRLEGISCATCIRTIMAMEILRNE